MLLDEVAHDRQAEAEAAVRAVFELSSWEKRSKTCGKNPGSIPAPVSLTLMRAHPSAFSSVTVT